MRLNKPQKSSESKVMKLVNLAGTTVMLNLLFLLACLPIVTIGPALSGLYSGVRYMIRGEGPVRGFWEGFKTHFVRMMIAGVIFTLIFAYFVIILNSAYNTWLEYGVFRDLVVHGVAALMPLMLFAALIPLNIYIPYNTVDWLKNCVNMVFKAPLWLLVSGLMLAAPVISFVFAWDMFFLILVVFVGFWCSLAGFVSTLLLKDTLVDMLLEYRDEHPEDNENQEPQEEEEET